MNCGEPAARTGTFSASINFTLYLWGGYVDNSAKHLDEVYARDSFSSSWRCYNTNNTLPDGYYNGACTTIGSFIYVYGGWNQNGMYGGGLFQLNTQTFQWKEIAPAEVEGSPMKKILPGMVGYKGKLYLFGGYSDSDSTDRIQPGSHYLLGFTNEFHSYDLTTGVWSSPVTTGEHPPPCFNFSFTTTDSKIAVLFGGSLADKEVNKAMYLLNLCEMHWTERTKFGYQQWPTGRWAHTATYLDGHPYILLIGGFGKGGVLSDVWLLKTTNWKWKEIQVLNPVFQRYGHCAAVLSSTPEMVKIILFGGMNALQQCIANTTIITLEKKKLNTSWRQKEEWTITEILDQDKHISAEETQQRSSQPGSQHFHTTTGIFQSAYEINSCNEEQREVKTVSTYPSLPLVMLNQGIEQTTGFSTESQVSVVYEGKRSCVNWEEGGIALYFEDQGNTPDSTTHCPVQISMARYGAFRYLNAVEPLSRIYYLHHAVPLNTSVTIRIQHNSPEEDIPQLCFITSSDHQPPFDFTLLQGGNFTSTFGEITVKRFSFYSVGRLLTKYRVRGILSLMEKTYQASLFVSSQPQCFPSEHCRWNIYVSVVKNCSIFKKSVEEFIENKYKDVVKCSATKLVRFTRTSSEVSVLSPSFSGQVDSQLVAADHPSMKKIDISSYVDGCPPHVKFVLRLAKESKHHPDMKFTLEGLEEPYNVLYFDQGTTLHSCLYSSQHSDDSYVSQISHQPSYSSQSEIPFTLKTLTSVKVQDSRTNCRLHMINEICPRWKEMGDLLGLTDSLISNIEYTHQRDARACCREVIKEWLNQADGSYSYSASWEGLCDLLTDMELSSLMEQVKMMHCSNQ